jgi:hypothetical protein
MTCGRKSCLSAAFLLGCLAYISMAQGAGEDLGQNLGTLFEVPMDAYTVGAGFQGLYHTRH